MSAVILPFPRNARAADARVRAIKEALVERAKATGATLEQRSQALQVALKEYVVTGGSASSAIWKGKQCLPPLPRSPYRTPQPPPEAA